MPALKRSLKNSHSPKSHNLLCCCIGNHWMINVRTTAKTLGGVSQWNWISLKMTFMRDEIRTLNGQKWRCLCHLRNVSKSIHPPDTWNHNHVKRNQPNAAISNKSMNHVGGRPSQFRQKPLFWTPKSHQEREKTSWMFLPKILKFEKPLKGSQHLPSHGKGAAKNQTKMKWTSNTEMKGYWSSFMRQGQICSFS